MTHASLSSATLQRFSPIRNGIKAQINTATRAINLAATIFYSPKLENNHFISLRAVMAKKGIGKKFHIVNKTFFIGNSWMCIIYQKIMVRLTDLLWKFKKVLLFRRNFL